MFAPFISKVFSCFYVVSSRTDSWIAGEGQNIWGNCDTKQLKTNAFVPFFNILFKTSVIYILWLHVRFGQKAGNYELVIAAARHYWNAIKPFIVEPIERELLREPMEAVLECIAAVAANEVGKEDEVRRKRV